MLQCQMPQTATVTSNVGRSRGQTSRLDRRMRNRKLMIAARLMIRRSQRIILRVSTNRRLTADALGRGRPVPIHNHRSLIGLPHNDHSLIGPLQRHPTHRNHLDQATTHRHRPGTGLRGVHLEMLKLLNRIGLSRPEGLSRRQGQPQTKPNHRARKTRSLRDRTIRPGDAAMAEVTPRLSTEQLAFPTVALATFKSREPPLFAQAIVPLGRARVGT